MTGFDKFILKHAMLPMFKSFLAQGCVMLGEANMGKTPVALAVCLMLSRYFITTYNLEADPQLRQASDLDFFRGEPGAVFQPFLLDDSNLALQAMEKLKAFLDVSEEEAMTYQRWGASKFVRNQFRIANANTYDSQAEATIPDMFQGDEVDRIPKAKFYELIEPALMKNTSKQDVGALLKRACFIVVSKKYVYVKKGAQDVVIRYRNESGSLLTPEAGARYMAWKENGVLPADDLLRAEVDVEQRLFNRIVMGKPPQQSRWARGALLQP